MLSTRFWTRFIFCSYNATNIFPSGLFLEHLGEPKVNQFLSGDGRFKYRHSKFIN